MAEHEATRTEKVTPAAWRLPPELLTCVLNWTGDYELATTLEHPHDLPVTSPWLEQATELDWAILLSGQSIDKVKECFERRGKRTFTQWGARVMIRFSYVHILAYFLERDPDQLRRECGSLLPVVASAWGRVKVLEWAMSSAFRLEPDANELTEAMDEASRHGQVESLEFWKQSGLKLRYSETALNSATIKRQIKCLEWWKASGLPLKIGNVLDFASMEGTTVCLEWWKNSGLPLSYTRAALWHVSRSGNVPLLDWWKGSGLSLYYDKEVIIVATRFGQVHVLQWWLDSGLDLEYRYFDIEEAIEDALAGKEAVLRWWQSLGYDPSHDSFEWTKLRNFRTHRDD